MSSLNFLNNNENMYSLRSKIPSKDDLKKGLVMVPEKRRPLRARENILNNNNNATRILAQKKDNGIKKIKKDSIEIETQPIKPLPTVQEQQKCLSPLKAFSTLTLQDLYDVDNADINDEIALAVYAKDIYDYLFYLEEIQIDLKDNYIKSVDLTINMRQILIDWIIQIHQHFKLLPETLYLTTNIIDRYLQKVDKIARKNLQLLGVTAMFIACKFEELYIMEVNDFVYVTKNTYTAQEILTMEIDVLRIIDFDFKIPYAIQFLRRFSKIAQVSYEEHTMSKFLIELTLLDPSILSKKASLIAASALCLSLKMFKEMANLMDKKINNFDDIPKDLWNDLLEYHTHYTVDDLVDTMKYFVKHMPKYTTSSQYKTIFSKYSSPKFGNVGNVMVEYIKDNS